MKSLRCAFDWLAREPHQRDGLRALQICTGLMLLFRSSTEIRHAPYLWGPHGLGTGSSAAFLPPSLARWVDYVYASDLSVYGIVIVMALGGAALVLGHYTRIAAAALLTFRLLESRLTQLGDGGDNIVRLILFYMLFALPAGKAAKDWSAAVWFHNLAILAIGLQMGVIYLTSGLMKALGEKWTNGTALYTISQVEWFSHPALRGVFINPWVTAAATYGTLFFQLWFPIAVLTRFRRIWLLMGLGLHLGIAAFMGLICFSVVMIGLELFLITDAEYAQLSGWLERAQRFRDRAHMALLRRQPTPFDGAGH